MEKINIAELLKDCPRGMELDCINYNGVVTFEEISNCSDYPIKITVKYNNECATHTLTKYGQTCISSYNKCIIFPKGKTTWEGFHRPFKDGDIIHICDEYSAALRGFCRGAKFADKTMLDRACEWLAKHISPEEIYETDETPTTYLTVNLHDNMLDFITAFRQAMEGE